MEKKVRVDKIVLNVNDKQVELTLEEAKDLNKILNDMFKQTPEKDIVYIPYTVPYTPYEPYKIWYVDGTAKKWDGIFNPAKFVSGTSTNGDFPYETGSINLTCTP
jgi:hypothetical protein